MAYRFSAIHRTPTTMSVFGNVIDSSLSQKGFGNGGAKYRRYGISANMPRHDQAFRRMLDPELVAPQQFASRKVECRPPGCDYDEFAVWRDRVGVARLVEPFRLASNECGAALPAQPGPRRAGWPNAQHPMCLSTPSETRCADTGSPHIQQSACPGWHHGTPSSLRSAASNPGCRGGTQSGQSPRRGACQRRRGVPAVPGNGCSGARNRGTPSSPMMSGAAHRFTGTAGCVGSEWRWSSSYVSGIVQRDAATSNRAQQCSGMVAMSRRP